MKLSLTIIVAGALAGGSLLAQDSTEDAAAGTIPSAFGPGRYQATWSSNPFLRRSAPLSPVTMPWAAVWNLTGMYKDVHGAVAVSIQNTKTGEFKWITSGGGQAFRLVSACFSRHRGQASAIIEKDGEKALIKYDESLATGS